MGRAMFYREISQSFEVPVQGRGFYGRNNVKIRQMIRECSIVYGIRTKLPEIQIRQETVIIRQQSREATDVRSEKEIVKVPKLELKEAKLVPENVPETDTNNVRNRNMSENDIKLKKKIDEIFFNEKFVPDHLNELENELE